MMIENKIKWKDNIKKHWQENKPSWYITLFFLLLTYGIRLTSIYLSHDTEAIISVRESLYNSWYSMGRFGLVFLKKLLGVYTFNPYAASFLMFVTMILASFLWTYLFSALCGKGRTKYFAWVFPAVFYSSTIMAEQFGFMLQAYEVGLTFALLGAVILFQYWIILNKKRVFFYIPALLLLFLIFSVYQSFIFLYPLAVTAGLLIYCEGEKGEKMTNKELFAVLIKFVGLFFAAFLAYWFADKMITDYLHITRTDYLMEQIQWGKAPIKENLAKIFAHVKAVYSGKGIYYSKIYILTSLLFLITVIYRAIKRQKGAFLYLVMGFFCLSGPFWLTVIMAGRSVERASFSLPFLNGFFLFYLLLLWKKKGRFLFAAILCLGFLASFKQGLMSSRLYYTNYLQYQEDVRLAVKITDRIDQLNLGEIPKEPVVFIGRRLPQANESAIPGEELELIGKSFWELSFGNVHGTWVMNHFLDAVGYSYVYPDAEQVKKAESIAEDMPTWPDEGSVAAKDGLIIVCFSH